MCSETCPSLATGTSQARFQCLEHITVSPGQHALDDFEIQSSIPQRTQEATRVKSPGQRRLVAQLGCLGLGHGVDMTHPQFDARQHELRFHPPGQQGHFQCLDYHFGRLAERTPCLRHL
ncbi:hypothetical protein D3C83_45050 [compost metagenome]